MRTPDVTKVSKAKVNFDLIELSFGERHMIIEAYLFRLIQADLLDSIRIYRIKITRIEKKGILPVQ